MTRKSWRQTVKASLPFKSVLIDIGAL